MVQSNLKRIPISVIVLTFNEEANIRTCLESVADWCHELFIVDSGSTDNTCSVAQGFGAQVFEHEFETHARQWLWALQHIPLASEWVLGLDADQRITPELYQELSKLFLESSNKLKNIDGIYIKRRQIFRGQWIRHGGYYPKYLLKLFRCNHMHLDENDLMDHHFYVNGKTIQMQHDLIEDNQKEYDLSFWLTKHVRYAHLHAQEELVRYDAPESWLIKPAPFGNPDQRVAWLKQHWYRLPLFVRPLLYFLYRYFLCLGFLDGKQGFIFHFLQGFWYRLLVDIHLSDYRANREISVKQ